MDPPFKFQNSDVLLPYFGLNLIQIYYSLTSARHQKNGLELWHLQRQRHFSHVILPVILYYLIIYRSQVFIRDSYDISYSYLHYNTLYLPQNFSNLGVVGIVNNAGHKTNYFLLNLQIEYIKESCFIFLLYNSCWRNFQVLWKLVLLDYHNQFGRSYRMCILNNNECITCVQQPEKQKLLNTVSIMLHILEII